MKRVQRIVILLLPPMLLAGVVLAGFANRQYFLQDALNGTVSPHGRMNLQRAAHSATLLRSGQILIAGGMLNAEGDELNTAAAELYDPVARTFKPIGQMQAPRSGHTAALLGNGDVLLSGGFDQGASLSTSEIYHSESGTFSSTGDMSVGRDRHSATLLNDETVLITGGNANRGVMAHANAEIYDPKTGRFSPVGNMTVARNAHAAILLQNGTVLITGGSAKRFAEVLSSAEVYDPLSRAFSLVGAMNAVRHKHGSALLPDGRVLISGGSDNAREMGGRDDTAEIYDPQQKSFVMTGSMIRARFKVTAAVVGLRDGRVLVAGDGRYAEVYIPSSGLYGTASGRMDDSWMHSTAVALADGSVLITGGYNEDMAVTAGAWLYRPT